MKSLIAILVLLGLLTTQVAAFDEPLEGHLTLDVKGATLKTKVLRDYIGVTKNAESRWNELPGFSFSYVQSGDALIPEFSGAITSDHPNWEWVLTPGTITKMDKGTRISLPFALMEKNENCLLNGYIVYDMTAGKVSSKAKLQIASETCLYVKFDMWGKMKASWQAAPVQNRDQLIANYEREQATNLPTRPITDLIHEYPDVTLSSLSESTRINPEDMSHYGILKDGIHYVSGCSTRKGIYPHCDQMLMPSYSFAKSLVASFALMRLELLYPGSSHEKIKDFVPECKGKAWQDVRFIDALNMATGNFYSLGAERDEGSKAYQALFLAKSHAEKIKFSCEHFPHKSKPDTTFVYHTSDTYILGAALNAYWKAKMGTDRDFFRDLIVTDIFTPLGLSASAKWTRRTYDSVSQPFTGWGLTLNRNDFAKLIWFLGGYNETLQPTSPFDAKMFNAVLQKNEGDRGMDASQSFRPDAESLIKYNKGFWAYNMQDKLGCDQATWLPYLSGYGGLSAVILPNNMGFYNISDGGKHAFANALYEIHKIRSLCEGNNR